MATKRTMSDLKLLENGRITIENLQKQTEMTTIMAQFGYDSEAILEGKALFDAARATYDHHIKYKDLLKEKVNQFKVTQHQLQTLYGLHRKKAKLVFRNDPMAQTQLELTGRVPRNFLPWLEIVRTFYNMLTDNPDLAHSLLRLKVTPDEIREGHTLITKLEEHRSDYFRAKGEYQLSTTTKEQALNALHQWISRLQATAKIAFMENKGVVHLLEGKS